MLLPENTLLERKSAEETTSIEMSLQVQLPARVMNDTKQRQTAWQKAKEFGWLDLHKSALMSRFYSEFKCCSVYKRGLIPVDQVAQFVLELCSISAPNPNRSHILITIIVRPTTSCPLLPPPPLLRLHLLARPPSHSACTTCRNAAYVPVPHTGRAVVYIARHKYRL